MDELDEILGTMPKAEEKKEEENKNDDVTIEDKGLDNAIKREEEKIAMLTELRDKKRALKAELNDDEPAPKPEPKSTGDADLDTAEGWMNHIDKKTNEAVGGVKDELEQLKSVQRKKALKDFLSIHPEYADKEKLKVLVEKSERVRAINGRSNVDSEDIFETLEDTWAMDNRKTIAQQAAQFHQAQEDANIDMADIASSGGGNYERNVSTSSGATASDRRSAAIAGMSIDKYMKLKVQLEESEM